MHQISALPSGMLAKISFIGSILYPLSRFNTVLLHSTLSLSFLLYHPLLFLTHLQSLVMQSSQVKSGEGYLKFICLERVINYPEPPSQGSSFVYLCLGRDRTLNRDRGTEEWKSKLKLLFFSVTRFGGKITTLATFQKSLGSSKSFIKC